MMFLEYILTRIEQLKLKTEVEINMKSPLVLWKRHYSKLIVYSRKATLKKLFLAGNLKNYGHEMSD